MPRRPLTIFLLFILIFSIFQTVRAENGIKVLSPEVEYAFGDRIYFQAEIESDVEIQNVELVIEAPGMSTFVGTVTYTAPDELRFVYDLGQRPLRLFSSVSYYYRFETDGGERIVSETFSFPYLDNRFQWQTLTNDKFRVYWYEGEVTLARDVLDAAEAGREQVLELLQRPKNNQQISIYLYASQDALQSTLALSDASWVGGHADPELGAVVVALPPGADRDLEIQRQVPHEVTHVMLYRFMGSGYQYLPRWVSEGIAAQIELFPNPEYEVVLEKAHREGTLIPIADLCHTLPADQERVILAYAEAGSLMTYIMQEYGITGVRALIGAYDQGVSCGRGVEIALGRELPALERAWRRDAFGIRLQPLMLPALVVLGVMIVVAFGFLLRRRLVRNQLANGGRSDDNRQET